MRIVAIVLGAVFAVAVALFSLALAIEPAPRPCPQGSVRAIIQDAGSCLGDYKNRVANEPIAFCTVRREVCMPTITAPANEMPPAAPDPVQP